MSYIQEIKPIDPQFGIEDVELKKPEIYEKGWGREIWIANTDKYCGKILEFNEGAEFSMHYHMLKHETFYILEGEVEIRGFDLKKAVMQSVTHGEGSVIIIPPGQPHKIIAKKKSRIIEVSTTHYESDSYRIIPGDSQKKQHG
jgi:mannose-6-phosphate isomerase-like protein (cupin superfamily)